MEANKEEISSASLADQLFGPKQPSPSLVPSKAHTSDNVSSEETKKNCDCATKRDCLDNKDKRPSRMIDLSAYYEPLPVSQPFSYSSSIYYGGQDNYPRPTKNTPGHSTIYNKDLEDDGLATRGNWWMGSLYY